MKYKIIAGHSNVLPESMKDECSSEEFNTIWECEEWIHNEVDHRMYKYALHLDADTEEDLDRFREIEANLMTVIHQHTGESVPFYKSRRVLPFRTLGVLPKENLNDFDDEFGDIEAVKKQYVKPIPMNLLEKKAESLVILMEECGEVIQEASKLIRFPQNFPHALAKEIGDLQCIMDIAMSIHDINPMDVMRYKREKRIKLETYSKLV